MKRATLFIIVISLSFCAGFGFNSLINQQNTETKQARATGIGGIFFKCKDPKKMKEWYSKNLGLNTNAYGAVFEWYQGADSTQKGFTQWSPFPETTKYFGKPEQQLMVNYRVENLEALAINFKKNGVTIVDSIETYEYGKFLHVEDIEGNRIELWEPNDIEYEKMGLQMGAKTTK